MKVLRSGFVVDDSVGLLCQSSFGLESFEGSPRCSGHAVCRRTSYHGYGEYSQKQPNPTLED
jgi:hypothetical protein